MGCLISDIFVQETIEDAIGYFWTHPGPQGSTPGSSRGHPGGRNEKIRKYRVVRYRFSEIKGQKLNENVQNNF